MTNMANFNVLDIPFFSQKECEVEYIEEGYSSACFIVTCTEKIFSSSLGNSSELDGLSQDEVTRYFVRLLNLNDKVDFDQFLLLKVLAGLNVTACIVYADENCLVMEYLDGITLAKAAIEIERKQHVAIKTVSKFHSTNIATLAVKNQHDLAPTLDLKQLISSLLQPLNVEHFFNPYQQQTLEKLQNNLIDFEGELDRAEYTLCHGDLNYSNIMIDENHKTWLIDFECALFAPREYDIAMFIAINELSVELLPLIISQYDQNTSLSLNRSLVLQFLPYCYLINALWFLGQVDEVTNLNEENNVNKNNVTELSQQGLKLQALKCDAICLNMREQAIKQMCLFDKLAPINQTLTFK